MIKLYTDTSLLTEKNRKLIFPLFLDLWYLKNPELLSVYTIVDSPKEADVFVLPLQYSYFKKTNSELVDHFLAQVQKLNKKLWVYTAGDYGVSLKNSTIVSFRLGGFHSKMNEETIVLPSFILDPYNTEYLHDFHTLPLSNKPTIGFVGHAHFSAIKFLKECYQYLKHSGKVLLGTTQDDYQAFYPSSIIRSKILQKIEKSNKLKTNFIKRKNYRAGANSETSLKKTTAEFFNNIYDNQYTLCVRGVGNFSVRFYETLAVGRIPILINTDCRLPLHNLIDWSKHCLIINNRKELEQNVIDFHNKHNEKSFKIIQKSNRDLWLNSLKREKYFIKIYHKFKI